MHSCICKRLGLFIVEQDGYCIPINLLAEKIECEEHSKIFMDEKALFANLGRMRDNLRFSQMIAFNGKLQNVTWNPILQERFVWKMTKDGLQNSRHLMDTLCKRQDIHMWISNASLEDLCANRYLLTLILERNPEYYALSVSLRDRLERIDVHRVFEFLYFTSFEFLKQCFMNGSQKVTVVDRDICDVFNCAKIIASSSDRIVCTLIKENVMRMEFPRTVLYLKKEPNTFHTFMDCKVMIFFDALIRFLPSLIRINGELHEPRIFTYKVLVLESISIKEAVGGQTLLQWLKEKVIDNISMFALSYCVNSVARHLCGVTDRHANNIKIIPERNQYVNIDNKYGLGISRPYGLDTHGTGMLHELNDFFGETIMQEVKSIAVDLLSYLRICHGKDIISLGKIVFYDLVAASHIEEFLNEKLSQEQELVDSFSTSIKNTTKHTIQILKSS